jgi:hypothetical protein
MVELVHGIVPMGSAQTAEFEWVSPRGVVTLVDMKKIEDQLERFADSPSHILHAKIIGGTRDGVVARASKKFPAGNQRKSAAGAQAATHPSSKSAAIGNPAPGKYHLAAEPPAGVEKPAGAGAEKLAAAEPPPLLKMVATFDPYTAELDDSSDVLVPKHDVDVYVDRQKGIQVAERIRKFSENLLLGSHQKVKYMW